MKKYSSYFENDMHPEFKMLNHLLDTDLFKNKKYNYIPRYSINEKEASTPGPGVVFMAEDYELTIFMSEHSWLKSEYLKKVGNKWKLKGIKYT